MVSRFSSTLFLFAVVLFAGCKREVESTSSLPSTPLPAQDVTLRLAVVDDPALASAVGRLRGEWNARTGGSFEVVELPREELLADTPLSADAVIYPARYLGELVEREVIAPVRPSVVEREGFDEGDLFELVRLETVRWGEDRYALPLGSPVLVLYYRADLLEKLGRAPPTTWQEYDELAAFLSDRANLGEAAPVEGEPWHGALEPLADGWAARMLLARAAPYIRHRNQYSTYFQIETMEPLLASPGFVRALEELVAARRASQMPTLDPAGVRRAFYAGETALAISWPTGAEGEAESPERLRIGFAELPGSREVFDHGEGVWERREADESPQVPLLGIAGRLASVTESSTRAAVAQRLLAWLAGPEMSRQIAPASPATTLARHSQTVQPSAWVESAVDPVAAEQYADAVSRSLQRARWLHLPRIPGSDRYLAALDAAVKRALAGDAEPAVALQQAAEAWREITESLGRDAQQQAYHRSLGL